MRCPVCNSTRFKIVKGKGKCKKCGYAFDKGYDPTKKSNKDGKK